MAYAKKRKAASENFNVGEDEIERRVMFVKEKAKSVYKQKLTKARALELLHNTDLDEQKVVSRMGASEDSDDDDGKEQEALKKVQKRRAPSSSSKSNSAKRRRVAGVSKPTASIFHMMGSQAQKGKSPSQSISLKNMFTGSQRHRGSATLPASIQMGSLEEDRVEPDCLFAIFRNSTGLLLRNAIATVGQIHQISRKAQAGLPLYIKIMPERMVEAPASGGGSRLMKLPQQIRLTAKAHGGRSDMVEIVFEHNPRRIGSFAKFENGFDQDISVGCLASEIGNICKVIDKKTDVGILVRLANDGAPGLRTTEIKFNLKKPKTEFLYEIMPFNMKDALDQELGADLADLAKFESPAESQHDDDFAPDDLSTVVAAKPEDCSVADVQRSKNDLQASILINTGNFKDVIKSLKGFTEVMVLRFAEVNPAGEIDLEFYGQNETSKSCVSGKVPGVHIYIRDKAVVTQDIKLSLKILGRITSLENIASKVKIDIHRINPVSLFFKFAPHAGQGSINYFVGTVPDSILAAEDEPAYDPDPTFPEEIM